MDDLLLFTPTKKSHVAILEDLLKALLKNGLKIPLKKCQLFRNKLQYMGNTIFAKDKIVFVKPLIQKFRPPIMVKGCRCFAGMVNFFNIFCPELQKLLKPMYDLTRKGRQFIWREKQQLTFEEIKCRLVKLLVLNLPDNRGRFHSVNSLLEELCIKFRMENQNW